MAAVQTYNREAARFVQVPALLCICRKDASAANALQQSRHQAHWPACMRYACHALTISCGLCTRSQCAPGAAASPLSAEPCMPMPMPMDLACLTQPCCLRCPAGEDGPHRHRGTDTGHTSHSSHGESCSCSARCACCAAAHGCSVTGTGAASMC